MSRADVIAGVLAEHRFVPTRSQDGGSNYGWCDGGDSWATKHISAHEAHVAAVLAAAEPAAEQARAGALTEAEAALDRVRVLLKDPDDTQWWPVQPYVDPVAEEELVEVQVLSLDRLRAALAGDAEHERSGTREYGLQLESGRVIVGPGWACEGDVIAASSPHGRRPGGDLVVRVGDGPWSVVRRLDQAGT